MPEYWYNVNTHEVEEDAMSDWSQLMARTRRAKKPNTPWRRSRPATNPGKRATRTTSPRG